MPNDYLRNMRASLTALRSPAAVTTATRTPTSRRAAGTTAQAGSSQPAASLEQPITQPIPPLREHAHHLPHVPIGLGDEIQGFDQIPGLFATGVVFLVLGQTGRAVGGRKYWY